MKKLLLLLLVFFILLFLIVILRNKNNPSVKIGSINFSAEIAKSDSQKEIGLSKYKKINSDFAMVFPFNKSGYYTFWMKDMKFPIDIIYTNKGKIVDIFKNVKPSKNDEELTIYKPKKLSDAVIEISAGLSQKYGFKDGDKVYINYK